MKIKLQFEQEDLETMLRQYFQDTGWKVLNLNELVEQFDEAFPQGIEVSAEVDPMHTPSRETVAVPDANDQVVDSGESEVTEGVEVVEDSNPRLSASEILGPPSDDDEDDDDGVREISHLLQRSEGLKR